MTQKWMQRRVVFEIYADTLLLFINSMFIYKKITYIGCNLCSSNRGVSRTLELGRRGGGLWVQLQKMFRATPS